MSTSEDWENEPDPEFPAFTYDISREGKLLTVDERYYWIPKMELIEGKLFWGKQRRSHVLAMILENFGMDAVVAIGDPQLWKEAIEARIKQDEDDDSDA